MSTRRRLALLRGRVSAEAPHYRQQVTSAGAALSYYDFTGPGAGRRFLYCRAGAYYIDARIKKA